MMDTIIIRDLELFLRVGVPEDERAKPQRLLVSIEIAHDFARAVEKDDLRSSIDYAAVCQRLAGMGGGPQLVSDRNPGRRDRRSAPARIRRDNRNRRGQEVRSPPDALRRSPRHAPR